MKHAWHASKENHNGLKSKQFNSATKNCVEKQLPHGRKLDGFTISKSKQNAISIHA